MDIDISKSLREGINVIVAGKLLWIQIKHIQLPNFCYRYGRLDHVLKTCETIMAEEDDLNLQYGS